MARKKQKRKSRRGRQEPLATIIGRRVRALRDEVGITRKGLAEQSEVALTSLVMLERGANAPSLPTLEKLARALRVRVADLLDEEPAPPKPEAGSKVFYRLMDRLRDRDREYLEQVEKLLKAFDAAVEVVSD